MKNMNICYYITVEIFYTFKRMRRRDRYSYSNDVPEYQDNYRYTDDPDYEESGVPDYGDENNPTVREQKVYSHTHIIPYPRTILYWAISIAAAAIMLGLTAVVLSLLYDPARSLPEDATFGVLNVTTLFDLQGTCINPIDPTCIPAVSLNTSCTEPLDDICIPSNITIDYLTVNEHTTLNNMVDVHGDFICSTPIWPSCLDISAQSCSIGMPLQESCIPDDLTLDSIILTTSMVCTANDIIDIGCLPEQIVNLTLPLPTELYNVTLFDTTTVAGPLICSIGGTIDPGCIDISNEVCDAGDLDINCIPTDLSSRTLSGSTQLIGPLECSVGGSINDNCIPIMLQNKTLTGTTTVSGTLMCSGGTLDNTCIDISGETCPGGALSVDCIPTDLILSSLIVGDLTINDPNVTFMGVTKANMLNVDLLMSNATIFKGPVTCSETDLISQGCIDISNESCVAGDLDINCIPTDLSSRTLSGTTQLIGPLECTGAGSIDQSCIPTTLSNIVLENTTDIKGILTCSAGGSFDPTCLDISNKACATGDLDINCIPTDLSSRTLSGATDLAGTMMCSLGGIIDIGCLPQQVVNLTLPTELYNITLLETTDLAGPLTCSMGGSIDPDCIDISNESCAAGDLDINCIPTDLSSRTLSGTTDVTGTMTCSMGGLIDESCIPPDLTLNSLTVNDITFMNLTITDHIIESTISELMMVDVLMANETILKNTVDLQGVFTCSGTGSIDVGCLPLSGLTLENSTLTGSTTCTSPIDQTCIPDPLTGITLDGSTVLDGPLTCPMGASIDQGCIDISMESCTAPINANCVDISGEVCMAPVDESCIPNTFTEPITFGNTLSLNSTMTCSENGFIDSSCIDVYFNEVTVGNLTCDSPSSQSCTAIVVNDRLDSIDAELNCSTTSLTLDCHANVDIGNLPEDGEVLTYNGTSDMWEPKPAGSQGCPGMKIISGRFTTSPLAESPLSADWSVTQVGGGTFNVSYTIPFTSVPSVTITTEKSAATCAGGIEFGTNTVSDVNMVSTCAEAINFIAIGCGN